MRTLACLFLLVEASFGQNPLGAISSQFQELVVRTNPAVVQILVRTLSSDSENTPLVRSERGNGSGVIVDSSGYIVTNSHVVANAKRIQVLVPQLASGNTQANPSLRAVGKIYEAKLVGDDQATDLAVLKIEETGLPHLQLGNSDAVVQGQLVFAFGSPLGLDNSVTMGIVSSVGRQIRPDDPMIYIQTDASINPGNSGGPLIDTNGLVIGINTFILSNSGGSEGIGFAAPANIVKTVYQQIREYGRVKRGQIGVYVTTINPLLAKALSLPQDSGVLIEDVVPKGSAEAAGLRVGDLIQTINGKPLENGRQFGVSVYQSANQTIELGLLRHGKPLLVRVAVLERPEDPDRLIELLEGESSRIRKLGILAINLDERVIPLFTNLRNFAGAVVVGVTSDLAVDAIHLAPGDIIHSLNNQPVLDLAGLKKMTEELEHGQVVALHIERQGRQMYVLIEVD